MSGPGRPPAAGSWLLWGVVAVFAGLMVLQSVSDWDIVDAGWWTLLLLVSMLAWFLTRADWRRGR